MKKFLLRVLSFLAVAMIGCIVLFAGVVALNKRALGSCHLRDGVDSVIVGDSHTAWAIDDAGIEGVQNISLNAEGYKYTYAKLRLLLRTEPKVRRVYLGFSYHNLSGYFDEYIDGPTFRYYADRYVGVLTLRDYGELIARSPWHAPDLFLRVIRQGFSNGINARCPLYGHFSEVPMTEVFNRATMERRIAEQYYSGGRLQPESSSNVEYLGKIIRLVREYGAELVMLNTPLHPEYRSRIPREYVERYDAYLRDNALQSFDFGDLRLTDADFLPDGDHTNFRGSMLASRRFAEYRRQSGAAR